MFTIIGGDGKEYGPVTTEQVRAWLAGGRANLDTKAKAAGSEEWRRVGDFPEFSGAGVTPPPPVATGPVDARAMADDLIARAAPLEISGCISRGWALLKSDFWPIVGATFVLSIVAAVAGSIPFLGLIASFLLTGVFYGGLYYFYLKKIRGQRLAEAAEVGLLGAGEGKLVHGWFKPRSARGARGNSGRWKRDFTTQGAKHTKTLTFPRMTRMSRIGEISSAFARFATLAVKIIRPNRITAKHAKHAKINPA